MSELTNGPLSSVEEITAVNEDITQLKALDDSLKCGICYEYFETCVMTNCCHNFCSLCIRKYIQFKNECPVCFKELYDCHLRANRIVDNFIEIFPNVKDRIIRYIRTIKTLNPDTIYVSPSKKIIEEKTPKTRSSVIDKSSENNDNDVPVLHSSPKQRVIIPKIFQSPNRTNPSSSEKPTSVVECPVCSVPVPLTNVNRHLDDCLKRQKNSASKKNSPPAQKRAHLPKLVYRLMSSTQLRKKAMDYGLNSQGDTHVLKDRIQRYTAMYNAECDKTNPRPVAEIIRLVEKEEKTLTNQKVPKSVFSVSSEHVTCKTELNAQYLKENKKSFQELIDKVKNNDTNKSQDIQLSESLPEISQPLDYCEPSTSSFNFNALQNDDMLEIHEPKIETPEEITDENIFKENIVSVKSESTDDDNEKDSNSAKRRCLSSKRLNFDNLFDVAPIKLEPEIDIYEAPTDDETEKNFQNSPSPVIERRKRRKNSPKDPTIKKDLRKKNR